MRLAELKALCSPLRTEPSANMRGREPSRLRPSSNKNNASPPRPAYTRVYTLNMATVPVRELRQELARFIDRVADLREHVVVTRRGRPAAVLIPVDEYEAFEETAEILSDSDTMRAIEQGRREVERGSTVTLDQLRKELRQRRSRS